jgi:hypothetical protein
MPMPGTVDLEAFREQWLVDVKNENSSSVELGRRFAHKLVQQWLDIDDSSAELVYCDGSGDGGIDVAYLDAVDDAATIEDAPAKAYTWYLIQSKYGSAFAGEYALLSEGKKVVDTLEGKRPRLSSLAEGLLERLVAFRNGASDYDRVVLVFGTDYALTESEKRALDELRGIGRGRLGPLFDVESASIQTIYQRTLNEAAADTVARTTVPFTASLVASGLNLLVGSTSLTNIYRFLAAYRDRTEDLDQLYEKNVRRFLGSRGKVNRGMRDTLKSAPEQFGLYNNGITIVVTDFERAGNDTFRLVDPSIVNGCQTTRSIWEVLHTRLQIGGARDTPEIEAWRNRVAQGVVVTKVVKVGSGGERHLEAITRFTNAQNAMREKDFLALVSEFKTWARQMAERYGIFLEIQRGGWDSRRALQKKSRSEVRQFEQVANAFDLLKVYGAGWLGEVELASSSSTAFLPEGSAFKRILHPQGVRVAEAFGVEDLYAAHLLKTAVDAAGIGRNAREENRRHTRFLYYMIVIDLLRAVIARGRLPTAHHSVSLSLIRLFNSGNERAKEALLNGAIEILGSYVIQSGKNYLGDLRAYKDRFSFDLAVRAIRALDTSPSVLA